jgi:hypothetical protein
VPAPTINFIPRASNGGVAPGFGQQPQYMDDGMGNFMSMNQVNPGPAAAAGAQPWQGPWMSMNEMTSGAPLDLYNQYPNGLSGAAGPTTGYPGQYPAGLAGAAGPTTGYPGQYPGGLAGGRGRGRFGGKLFLGILLGAAAMWFAKKQRWI